MRKLILATVLGLCSVLVAPIGAAAAPATGPSPSPDAACANRGTVNARTHTPSQAKDFVPHFHDFNGNGTSACYHANPNYPPASPDLE